jgi:hypothetical protein
MNKYLLGGAAAVAVVAIAPAIAQTAQPAPAPVIQRIHVAPKAHTRAEVGTHVRTMFEKLDANRDGYVTKAEAEAAKANRADRIAKRMERRGAAGSPGQRLANRGEMFDRLDTNRDGSISRAEFEAAPARHERRVVVRTDRNADGIADGPRAGGMRAMRMGMGMGLGGRMFDMADGNRDGRVTLQEATAAAYRHFDTADANRDGQITREERMQMHQRMRAERRPG